MTVTPTAPPARERILAAASRRYYLDGIRAASADRLLADAGVSKVTFYRHFPSKDDLVVAYLERAAEQERDQVLAQRAGHGQDPAAVLLWYADVIGGLSCGPGFRGCPFLKAAAELPEADHPGRRVIAAHRRWLTDQATELLTALDVPAARARATRLMMLRDGAMMAGYIDGSPQDVTGALVAAGRAVILGD